MGIRFCFYVFIIWILSISMGWSKTKDFTNLFKGKSFSNIARETETHSLNGQQVSVTLYSGYFLSHKGQKIYFEYRIPENYSGEDIVQISGFTEGAEFWHSSNEKGIYFKKAAVLSIDNLAIGKTRLRSFARKNIPKEISFSDDAKNLLALMEKLQIEIVTIMGHSRGAAVGAELGRGIIQKGKTKLKGFYDLNGFVSYISVSLLRQNFPSTPTGNFFHLSYEKVEPDGSMKTYYIESFEKYARELLKQWQEFERVYLDNPKRYNKTFVSGKNGYDEVNPSIRELTSTEFWSLQRDFPLLIHSYSEQGIKEIGLAQYIANVSTDGPREKVFEAMLAQLRSQRTVFSFNRQKYFIPLSSLPALSFILNSNVPVTLLGGTLDRIVNIGHFNLKVLALRSSGSMAPKVVLDVGGQERSFGPHYGPKRDIWGNQIVPLILSTCSQKIEKLSEASGK